MPYAPKKCDPTLEPIIHSPLDAYAAFCEQAKDTDRLRELPYGKHLQPAVDFSHNDYLGFARHPKLIQAAQRAAARYGTGATGARLLSGDSNLAHTLERRIARVKQAPRALIFSSGFALNASVPVALLDKNVLKTEPLVFCDRLVHASLYHAFAAAGVRIMRYHHQDLNHLAALLAASSTLERPRFIFTESVFGMDGDVTDIEALRELARRYRAMLYIDEAHATGVLGPGGSGIASRVVDDGGIVMGTFSKALGGSGAYLVCSDEIATFLLQRCSGFIYSTAAAPATLAAALTAWRLLPAYEEQRQQLAQHAASTRNALSELGYNIGKSTTHLIPIIFPAVETAVRARDHLARARIAVSLIRPPTVPPNAARIRIALSASHTEHDIDMLLSALRTFTG